MSSSIEIQLNGADLSKRKKEKENTRMKLENGFIELSTEEKEQLTGGMSEVIKAGITGVALGVVLLAGKMASNLKK